MYHRYCPPLLVNNYILFSEGWKYWDKRKFSFFFFFRERNAFVSHSPMEHKWFKTLFFLLGITKTENHEDLGESGGLRWGTGREPGLVFLPVDVKKVWLLDRVPPASENENIQRRILIGPDEIWVFSFYIRDRRGDSASQKKKWIPIITAPQRPAWTLIRRKCNLETNLEKCLRRLSKINLIVIATWN